MSYPGKVLVIGEYLSRRPMIRRSLLLLSPLALAIAYLSLLWVSNPPDVFRILLGAMTAYFFPPLGKESVIPISVTLLKSHGYGDFFLNAVVVPFSISFIDIIVALFLAWNFDLAMKIPVLGTWMRKMEEAGRKRISESRWQGALIFWGIVLFVIIPFQGSGGVAATIIGRMAGMDWKKTVLAISIGAISGCITIGIISYFAADTLREITGGSLFKMAAILIGIILLIFLIFWFISNRKYIREHIKNMRCRNDDRR